MGEVSAYYSSVNRDLMAMIPPDAGRVLEIGCGTGAMASQYRRINPKCEYVGVEMDVDAAAEAVCNPDLSFVHQDRIENVLNYLADEDRFDVLVFGDVMEHLEHPDAVLLQAVHYLQPGGSIVACVPNVQNWMVLSTLINGQWPSMDSGLFDRTHLRWFTRDSLVDMFEAAGLSVAKVVPRKIAVGGERLIEAVRAFGLAADADRFAEDCNAYQWLIHGVKGVVPSRKVLVRGFTAEACCARPRLTEPGVFVNTIPGFRYAEVPTKVDDGESVVVVRQRFNITEDAVRTHLKDGCLIVGEWDDDPWHEGFRDKLKVPSIEWALSACHAIAVSTEAVADLVRPINPNVAVFPNQIAAVGPKREYVESDVVRVYMGGQRKREDWQDAVKTVNRIIADDSDRYDFIVVHDRDLYEALETKRKTYYAFQPYEKYRALLRTCDVAISPLADTRFNRYKSDITEIECGAEGVRLYAAPRYIADLRNDLRALGVARRLGVIQNRMLRDHYRSRADQFNAWLDRKDELTAQLFERLPELKEAERL